MRVLITSDWYIPTVNGVVTSVINLKKGLEERGHEVRVLTLSRTIRSQYDSTGTVYISSMKADMVYPGARIGIISGSKYIDDIIAWKPDIVHSNCEFSTFKIARHIARKLHIPLIHTYHTVYENYTHYFSPSRKWGRKAVEAFTRRISNSVSAMIAPTEKVKNILKGYDVLSPVHVVPTGINEDKFLAIDRRSERERIRKQLGIRVDDIVLVSIGRIAKEKNCDELIRAISRIENPKVRLLIVGDGPYRNELENLIGKLGAIDKVILTGMVAPDNICSYYAAGDLFVSASTSETQGLTYIEALFSALPLLCHRDDSIRNVVFDGINGWQYSSEDDFIRKLEHFISNRKEWSILSFNSLLISQRFTIQAFARNIENVYERQISEAGLKTAL